MSSCSRNFMKLSRSIYTSATRKVSQTHCVRYFSLVSKSSTGPSLNHVTQRYVVFNKTSSIVPPYIAACRSSHHQTADGDSDLIHFLKEEIAFEEENVKSVPKLKHFDVQMDGTVVLLRRDFNGENIEVKFNCNDSLNVDDGESMSEEPAPEDEDDNPDIVSYPSFTVTITKPSGKTLLFNCNCNTGINDDADVDGDPEHEEEQYDLLRFDSVQVFNSDNVDKGKVYEAETENMDGELYSMLVNTLLERGINGIFVNDLIDLSTSVEHRHYLTFLKSLSDFMKEH